MIAVVFVALVLNEQVKNRQEFFKNLSLQLETRLIILNAIILGIVSGIVSISICSVDKSIVLIALPLGAYALISWRCLNIVKLAIER
ncbi:hypothetical protein E3E35_10970 [Thermococcus sp. GR7]|nr:hypothetical protein [Thermococcus sp. GR7]